MAAEGEESFSCLVAPGTELRCQCPRFHVAVTAWLVPEPHVPSRNRQAPRSRLPPIFCGSLVCGSAAGGPRQAARRCDTRSCIRCCISSRCPATGHGDAVSTLVTPPIPAPELPVVNVELDISLTLNCGLDLQVSVVHGLFVRS